MAQGRRSWAVPSHAGKWGKREVAGGAAVPSSPLRTGEGDQAAAVGQEGDGYAPSEMPEVRSTNVSPPQRAHASGVSRQADEALEPHPTPSCGHRHQATRHLPHSATGGSLFCAPGRASTAPPGTRLDVFTDNSSSPRYASQLPYSQTPDHSSASATFHLHPKDTPSDALNAPHQASECFKATRQTYFQTVR